MSKLTKDQLMEYFSAYPLFTARINKKPYTSPKVFQDNWLKKLYWIAISFYHIINIIFIYFLLFHKNWKNFSGKWISRLLQDKETNFTSLMFLCNNISKSIISNKWIRKFVKLCPEDLNVSEFFNLWLKVSKSQRQFMASSILPKNERNSLSWASSLLRIVSFVRFLGTT